jgi:hypothetical protein
MIHIQTNLFILVSCLFIISHCAVVIAKNGRKREKKKISSGFHRVSLLLEEILLQTSRIRTAAKVFVFLTNSICILFPFSFLLYFFFSFFRHCCDFISYYRSADQMKPYLKMDPSPSLAINP